MAQGKVKWFNTTKGFGFIVPSDGSKDVFLHETAISGRVPTEGDTVEYEVRDGKKGPQAANVSVI